MTLSLDAFLLVLRLFVGLLIAGHGAQKTFAAWGGLGLAGHAKRVEAMGFRPPAFWTHVSAWGELLGGIALAIGFLTPLAAAVLAADMLVAVFKVHLRNGLWITKGGYEYALTNLVLFSLVGLAGPGAYSVDAAIGLAPWSAPVFLAALVAAAVVTFASTSARVTAEERERGRPAA